MRVIFFGTPAIAVPTLNALVDAGHDIALVVSQPDRRRGRGKDLMPSPVKAAALQHGLRVTDKVSDVLTINADVGVLVAFGRLIKPEILDHIEIINLHPSLLPRWRGATPAEAAIMAGDVQTGICLMRLEVEMDAGPIYTRTLTDIAPTETSAELYRRLFATGNKELVALLTNEPLAEPQPQIGEPTYCGKYSADDFHIDWRQSASYITRLARIGRPWTTFRGKRLIVVSARIADTTEKRAIGELNGTHVTTGDGELELLTVQPEGKSAQDAKSWLNGAKPQQGETFE